MTVQTFRLFLSSPGDVVVERRRIAAVVSRLNGECAGRARIDMIRWETETYQAHATFQAQIPQAVECDLVLALFKWRLGTELPPDFPERLPTGEPYPSGTAYELLTAIEARKAGAVTPDVFVYRYAGSSPRLELDDPDRDRIERDWLRLKGFFDRWFLTPDGHFLAAFQTYASEDDLDTQIEALLRGWLEDKIAAGRILAWPDAIKGSPFPGLEAFGRRHAAVFFGRDRDVARAVELWQAVATKGTPFLLIVGASGAGKSSLARAGLVPRVTIPGVVEGVDLWRVASFRPGDSPDGPLAALSAALLVGPRDLPLSEEGRGPALPELVDGNVQDAPALAGLFAAEPAVGAALAVEALDRIGAAAQASERRQRLVRTDLVLVIDQLDELFAPGLSGFSRDSFVTAVAALAGTGRVWVAATLRADLYGAMLDHPGLKALKEAGASYDLAPPGPAELAEIVRRPAAAADLAFGRDPETGEGVDERLLREADRPDMLPLVQLALARLYEGRRQEGVPGEPVRTILPFDVYRDLGGLTGIIDEVGERALANLDPAAIRTLPRLTRDLAQFETEGALAGTLTVTPVPLDQAAPDQPNRRLIEALVASRLLTLTDAGDGTLVRLAHQRVLTDWARTREIVAGSADFYRIRGEIERRRQRWQLNRRPDLLLPRGLPLAEAENIVARYGDEIAPETRAFVRASRIRAGRAQMITGAAAVIFALVAAGAVFQTWVARQQTELAVRNFGIARQAVRDVVFNIVQGLSDVAGMRLDALRTILTTVQAGSDRLAEIAPDDPELLRARAAMFQNFARMYLTVGDVPEGRTNAERAVAILRRLVVLRPEDRRVEGDLSVPLVTLGDAVSQGGNLSGAVRHYDEALVLARTGAARAPDDPEIRRRVTLPLSRLGDARFRAGDEAGSLAAYRELLDILRREVAATPGDGELRDRLGIALFDLGYVALEGGDRDAAEPAYREGAGISQALAAEFPASVGMQRSLSVAYVNLGQLDEKSGRPAEAVGFYERAVAIERELVRRDPDNAERRRTLGIALEKLGNGAYYLSDWPRALAAYSENLAIFRALAAQSPLDLRYLRSVTVGLSLVGGVKRATADAAEAARLFEERLTLSRTLASRQPGNAEAQHDLVFALRDLGEVRGDTGEMQVGIALFREAIGIARILAGIDAAAVRPVMGLEQLLGALALLQGQIQDFDGALETYDEQVKVLRRLVDLRPATDQFRGQLAAALVKQGAFCALGRDGPEGLRIMEEGISLLRTIAAGGHLTARTTLVLALETRAMIAGSFKLTDLVLASRREVVEIRRVLAAGEAVPPRLALAGSLVLLADSSQDPLAALREAAAILGAVPEAELDDRSRTLKANLAERLGTLR
ncbi:AAA family ATPase [uncultured Enterovirga sp.]|uniref:nSTAND1 domain-containing NTPase n=1 Tax=uncultured Enterovirga sp. TaxID=2026352 RepID=UPI0035CBFF0D